MYVGIAVYRTLVEVTDLVLAVWSIRVFEQNFVKNNL